MSFFQGSLGQEVLIWDCSEFILARLPPLLGLFLALIVFSLVVVIFNLPRHQWMEILIRFQVPRFSLRNLMWGAALTRMVVVWFAERGNLDLE